MVFTATLLHCIERDDYINKAPCHFSGASGSAAGYANLILKVAIFVISVNSIIDMLYLRNSTCHALLVSTSLMFMKTLMMDSFDKHIYDIMFMYFLLASYLWNKLNMNLPRFLTL